MGRSSSEVLGARAVGLTAGGGVGDSIEFLLCKLIKVTAAMSLLS